MSRKYSLCGPTDTYLVSYHISLYSYIHRHKWLSSKNANSSKADSEHTAAERTPSGQEWTTAHTTWQHELSTHLQKDKGRSTPGPAAQKVIGLHVDHVRLPRSQASGDFFGEGKVAQKVAPLLPPLHHIAQSVSYNFFTVPRAKVRRLAHRKRKNRHVGRSGLILPASVVFLTPHPPFHHPYSASAMKIYPPQIYYFFIERATFHIQLINYKISVVCDWTLHWHNARQWMWCGE